MLYPSLKQGVKPRPTPRKPPRGTDGGDVALAKALRRIRGRRAAAEPPARSRSPLALAAP